jgi:hypothetical protein
MSQAVSQFLINWHLSSIMERIRMHMVLRLANSHVARVSKPSSLSGGSNFAGDNVV